MRIVAPALALLWLATVTGPALAHGGNPEAASFGAGFTHPFSGLDHLLAMVAVGAWAGQLGGAARWSVPLSFIAMMVAGSLLGSAGIAMPMVEAGILGSVVLFGALIACKARLPLGLGMSVAGLFALFHGHAHGAEMTSGLMVGLYGLGFATATALLHGVGFAVVAALRSSLVASAMLRWSGAGIAAAGLLMVLGA